MLLKRPTTSFQDMATLANHCLTTGALSLLRSITLTVHQQLPMTEWINDVLNLISASPLERFQIYSIGASFEALITEDLWSNLVLAHASRLVRISVHRMLISVEAIANICSQCTNLEELFVVMESSTLVCSRSCDVGDALNNAMRRTTWPTVCQ